LPVLGSLLAPALPVGNILPSLHLGQELNSVCANPLRI
jgi:hypothetical protein